MQLGGVVARLTDCMSWGMRKVVWNGKLYLVVILGMVDKPESNLHLKHIGKVSTFLSLVHLNTLYKLDILYVLSARILEKPAISLCEFPETSRLTLFPGHRTPGSLY